MSVNLNSEEIDLIEDQIDDILRHIKTVQSFMVELGKRLIESGRTDEGKRLIAKSLTHDQSKFSGIEWEYLHKPKTMKVKPTLLKMAVDHHAQTNDHHPQFWGSIHNMPDLSICEMVCDWCARSSQCGSSVTEWVQKEATERFIFDKNDPVYDKIMDYLSIILDRPLTEVKHL